MRDFLKFVAGIALAASLAGPAAHAATFYSDLQYRDFGGSTGVAKTTPFGRVQIEETSATKLTVTVTLANANSLFINTGGPHDPFLFNSVSDDVVTIVSPLTPDAQHGGFYDAGHGSFTPTPFGAMSDKIGCCSTYVAAVPSVWVPEVPAVWNRQHTRITRPAVHGYWTTATPERWIEQNGASHGIAGPLVFTLENAAGITFAGVGAGLSSTSDPQIFRFNGAFGTGEHLKSNAAGWWFTADIYDGASRLTYNVAARDAYTMVNIRDSMVPEPASWAMMIAGFGLAGALLRRRRAQAVAA